MLITGFRAFATSFRVTTVAIIDYSFTYRTLLEDSLSCSGRFKVAGSWASAETAVDRLSRAASQIVLIDCQFRGQSGIDTVAELRVRCPKTRCVMLSHHDDTTRLRAAFAAGAAGYLLKSEPPATILAGLDEVMAGGSPMSRLVTQRIITSFTHSYSPSNQQRVTRREGEILEFLTHGLTYKEIARKLGVSTATVKNHLNRIYRKLNVRSRTEAVVKWLKR